MTLKGLIGAAVGAAIAMTAATGAMANDWTKVKIGVEGAYPPFSQTEPDGSVTGFDIDIANAICAAMGAECEMVKQDWDGIIPALLAKKYDAIIASMSITAERQKVVDFTIKYYNTPAKFFAAKGSGLEDTMEGLKGKTVGVQRGTIHQDFMEKKFPDVDLKLYGTQDEVYLDLEAGRIDAGMADSVAVAEGFLNTDAGSGFEFFGGDYSDPEIHGDGAGIAVRKEDNLLRDKINRAILQIRDDGTYDAIAKKYFNFNVYGS